MCSSDLQRPDRIVFRTTRLLPAANGLTVAAAWQKGVVLPPTDMQKFGAIVQDNPALLYAGIGGLAVVLYYLVAWMLIGRDPPRGTIIPLFGPPDNMSAVAVRFVNQMAFDNKGFTAAIVGLGVNGHLKLVDAGGGQEIRKLESNRPLDATEKAVASALFLGQSRVSLENTEHQRINNAKTAALRTLKESYQGPSKLLTTNYGWSGLSFLATVLVTAAISVSYYPAFPG